MAGELAETEDAAPTSDLPFEAQEGAPDDGDSAEMEAESGAEQSPEGNG
jgi:hypothetical protein